MRLQACQCHPHELEHQRLQSDDFSSPSKRSPSTMSSLHELIGTHALCSSRRQSRPTASSAYPRQGSVWSWSCAKPSGTFLLLGTHPGFLYPVSSWCCLPRPSSPAQHACPHAMLFGHFVHLFHHLIHSHLLICRSDLGHLHPSRRTDLPPESSVQLLRHTYGKFSPCCAQSAVLPCRIQRR